ncbi:uncharacterized protein LOC141801119 isoform X2 [Halichoeres trimaculatus]|uniref:uncharacterized protein LOC141801119 isoform X2 n=1 Tax=Halichoeres trimaculatus TaxID=147232 RepID=UPI003D9ED6B0
MNQRMNSSKLKTFFLRSTTAVSLNERFSQVLADQETQPRTVTFNPIMLQERGGNDALQLVLLMKRQQQKPLLLKSRVSPLRMRQCVRKRRSVWTRLGWRSTTRRFLARRPGGFWSFRNKYKQKTWLTSSNRSTGDLRCRLGKSRHMMKRSAQKPTPNKSEPGASLHTSAMTCQTQLGAHLQKGGASTLRKLGWNRKGVKPTRKQLDAELDKYMSLSKRRLDQQLDEYMSKSKSRLDAQLDEYMSMAGQGDLTWDKVCGDTDLTWY